MAKRKRRPKGPQVGVRKDVWQAVFLARLEIHGRPGMAAKEAGVCRAIVYYHRTNDPEFAAQWRDAQELAADKLEAKARELALGSATREPSEDMLKFLLRSLRPRTFDRQKTQEVDVNLGGQEDNPVQVVSVIRQFTVKNREEADAFTRRQAARQDAHGQNGNGKATH